MDLVTLLVIVNVTTTGGVSNVPTHLALERLNVRDMVSVMLPFTSVSVTQDGKVLTVAPQTVPVNQTVMDVALVLNLVTHLNVSTAKVTGMGQLVMTPVWRVPPMRTIPNVFVIKSVGMAMAVISNAPITVVVMKTETVIVVTWLAGMEHSARSPDAHGIPRPD